MKSKCSSLQASWAKVPFAKTTSPSAIRDGAAQPRQKNRNISYVFSFFKSVKKDCLDINKIAEPI